MSKQALLDTKQCNFLRQNKSFVLKEVAKVIRDDVLSMMEHAPGIPWPPTVESLESQERQPPESLRLFLTHLIHSTEHTPGEEVQAYVKSFSQDIVHGISKGDFLTSKHVLLGCGLHSITGMKMSISILSHFGHSCSYRKVQEIVTAQAELVQKMRSLQYPLPLIPKNPQSKVSTILWWDNFDCNKETKEGSIHTCHGIAFQEESEQTQHRDETMEVVRSKQRTVTVLPHVLPRRKILPHKEPNLFPGNPTFTCDTTFANDVLFSWKLLRHIYGAADQQTVLRFIGWVMLMFSKLNSTRTKITFLHPIRNPITDYSTVLECIYQSQKLSFASNMKYTHITVDAGAAAKFYHVVWNNSTEFKNVLIHLGDFHTMMQFFCIIGKIITGSGFEETVYQGGLCTSGGIKGVLSGKHYNRSWTVHECFANALDRLFCESIVISCSSGLEASVKEIKNEDDLKTVINASSFKEHEVQYREKKLQCLKGQHGKTAQFWMMNLELMDLQQKLHFSVNMNDFELRLHCLRAFVSLCFATNKQNYARYGSYYVLLLEHLEETHPGAKAELQEKGLSVCRNDLDIRQAVDMAGEQTFMKSSKTTGSLKNFITQESTYGKWVLSQLFQAQFVAALKNQAGVSKSSNNPRKCLRESQIRKSERNAENIINTLKNVFINPFSPDLDGNHLYNLASGCPLPGDITESLLSVAARGTSLRNTFFKRLRQSQEDKELLFNQV